MNFIRAFRGVPKGAIYPVTYAEGDECPIELEQAAIEQCAVEVNQQDPMKLKKIIRNKNRKN